MKSQIVINKKRSAKGDSLVGLLVATIIFSFVAMAIMGMLTINVVESNKLMTRTDNMTGARFGMEKLGRIVRMARNMGDIQGQIPQDPYHYAGAPPGPTDDFNAAVEGTSAAVLANGEVMTSAAFPSAADPFWPSPGLPYPHGTSLGTAPPGWGNGPYRLSMDTLVVQLPVFDRNGWPRAQLTGASYGNAWLPMMDTYVFRVVPDTTRTNTGGVNFFQLQMACWPAQGGNTNAPASMTPGVPQTLMSGIIGPLSLNDPTRIAAFQYVHRDPNYGTINGAPVDGPLQTDFSADTENENQLGNFVGVVANVQLMSKDAAHRASVMPLRTEMYLRNNSQASQTVWSPN